MSDLGDANWSEIAASNNASPPNGWPEGMAPSGVNNSARENMAALKRWWDRSNPVKTSAGSSTAFTLTYDLAAFDYYDGEIHAFVADRDCVAATTLDVNSIGAKNVRKFVGGAFTNVANGDWLADQIVAVRYNETDDKFDIVWVSASWTDFVSLTADNTFTGKATFTDTVTMSGAAFNEAARLDVGSSAPNIGAAASNYIRITGTTTITAFDSVAAGIRRHVMFNASLTLTHNATSLILPANGANISTAPGDCATFVSEGSGNWRCEKYQRVDGQQVVPYVPPQRAYAFVTISGATATVQKQSGFTSVVRNSIGQFTCTLSSAMPDLHYRVLINGAVPITAGVPNAMLSSEDTTTPRTTTVFHVAFGFDNSGLQDPESFSIEVMA